MLSGGIIGLTAIGLSGDAFAASLARGASAKKNNLLQAIRNGSIFGSTEGLMCLIGWFLAVELSQFMSVVDHWIAVILLSAIGGKMIFEAMGEDEINDSKTSLEQPVYVIFLTAFGTSVDSAVVGGALSLSGAPIYTALVVGGVSGALSTIGFIVGPTAGRLLGKRAEMFGGLVLIMIGLSIWVSHMFL